MSNKTDLTPISEVNQGEFVQIWKNKYEPVNQIYIRNGDVFKPQIGNYIDRHLVELDGYLFTLCDKKENLFTRYKREKVIADALTLAEENAALRAEVERLRASLKLFVDQYTHCSDSEIKKSSGHFSDRILIARAALSSTDEEKG